MDQNKPVQKQLHQLMQQSSFTDDELRYILGELGKAKALLEALGPHYECAWRCVMLDRRGFESMACARGWPLGSY
jgi:hypothetical protein